MALYLTGYSESHEKLLAHNRSLSYFVAEAIGSEVQMGSLPDLLSHGPDHARQAIVATAQKERASLVILDGFRSMRGFMSGEQAAAEFQKIVDHPGVVLNFPLGALAHLGLGRAYALAGDKVKARRAYQDFLALWRDADADIPILKQANADYKQLE